MEAIRVLSALFLLLFSSLAIAQTSATGSSRLCWDQDDLTNVKGFNIFYGPASGEYNHVYNIGMAAPGSTYGVSDDYCSKTMLQLGIPNGTYYFNVNAFETQFSVESAVDGEVWVTLSASQPVRSGLKRSAFKFSGGGIGR